eukprot:1093988-Prymnesium_polylepis.1
MPWGAEEEDGGGIHLPAEYFLLLPLVAHRKLFGDFERCHTTPLQTLFLRPLAPIDDESAPLPATPPLPAHPAPPRRRPRHAH